MSVNRKQQTKKKVETNMNPVQTANTVAPAPANVAPAAPATADVTPATPAPVVVCTIQREKKDASGNTLKDDKGVPVLSKAWTFLATPYKRGDMATAKQTYPCPDFSTMSVADIVDFCGESMVIDLVAAKLALQFQTYSWEATPTDPIDSDSPKDIVGPMDVAKFTSFVQNFEARGESVADLQDKQNTMILQFSSIKDPVAMAKHIKDLEAITKRIQQAQEAKAEKKAKREAEEAAKAAAAKAKQS